MEANEQTLAQALRSLSGVPRGPERGLRVAEVTLDTVMGLLGYEKGLMAAGGGDQRPGLVVNRGMDPDYLRFMKEHYSHMPVMQAAATGTTLVFEDVEQEPRLAPVWGYMRRLGIRSLVIIPVRELRDELHAALALYSAERRRPEPSRLEMAECIVMHAGLLMANERLHEMRDYLIQQTVLEKSHDIIDALVAGIAHDYNNLLGGMLGLVSLLPSVSREETAELAALVEQQVEQAVQLTDSLLDLARTGEAGPEYGQSEIVSSVHKAVAAVPAMKLGEPGLARARVEMVVEAEDQAIWANISTVAFSRVILNLLINAVQALQGSPNPRVVVRLRRTGSRCVVEVDDNGPGVRAEDEERIFKAFVTRDKQRGTGIGLTAARGLVDRHGGTLMLRHREGPGACFVVSLRSGAETAQLPREIGGELPVAGGGRRVLVVEDEPVQRRMFVEALQAAGFAVDAFGEGREALEALRRIRYAGAILDYVIPGASGSELLAELRAREPSMAVLIVTGYAREPQLQAGADQWTRVVRKPVKGTELVGMLRDMLGA